MIRVLVKSYDDLRLWEGHSILVDEIYEDLNGSASNSNIASTTGGGEKKKKPKAIFTAVGGGGLIGGIMVGCERVGWGDGELFITLRCH